MESVYTLRRILTVYPALLHAYWQRAVAYRAAYVMWLVNASFPLVMMAIWIGLAQDGPIQGYTAADFASYYLASILVRQITNCGIVADLENLVRTGELSVYLLRPLDVMHHFVARVLASKVVSLPLVGMLVVAAILLTPGARFDIHLLNLLLFILACATGLAFEFLAQYCIGGLSFWMTRASGAGAAYQLARSFLGGYLVPLVMFPARVQGLLQILPFQSGLALPVEILTGHASPGDALTRLAVCCAWTFGLALGARLLWRAGRRVYSAVGA